MGFGTTKNLVFMGALSLSAVLVSCGPKQADKIGQAQLCIDKAGQGEAAACLEKISGIETESASLLRCSAGFIDEGFTQPTRFKSAFQALSGNGGNKTEAFMGVLAFSSKTTANANSTFAEETYQHCVKSNAKGFMLLGSMAKAATTLSSLAGGFTNGSQPSETDISNAINTAVNDPTARAAIGSAVATTYTASCKSGTQSNESLCKDLDSALGGVDISDSNAVGNALLAYWQNH